MASPVTALHRVGVRIFRQLPPRFRRQLVRAVTPNYTLGAVVLLRDESERLLLVRQAAGPPGWSLPGGLLDRGETPVKAAYRELVEETGVRLPVGTLTPMEPNAHVYTFAQQVDLVFTGTVDAASTKMAVDQVEVVEAGWYPLDELPLLTVATARLLGKYGIGPGAPTGPR